MPGFGAIILAAASPAPNSMWLWVSSEMEMVARLRCAMDPGETCRPLTANLTKQPLLFPSLGPTALLFFEQPMSAAASPRNALIGHLVAVLAGALCLALFGLLDDPSILREGVTLAHVGAGTLSLVLAGVMLLTVVGWFINRTAGVPAPVWGAREEG